MEFKQIEAFVNVIKYKSFSKAAEATFLTQPTISTHISSLEKELGCTLIDRKGKESRPTKQGRAFYNYAVSIINTRERAISAMGNFGRELAGVLDIKTSSIPGQYIVPKYIAAFHKEYPNVAFSFEQSDSEKVWNDLLDNMGEIGFTGAYEDNGLKCEPVFKDHSVLITPKNKKFLKLKERGDSVSITDFADEGFIWREEGSASRKSFEEAVRLAVGDRIAFSVATINNTEAVKRCVAEGLGVSVISKVSAEDNFSDYLSFEIEGINLEREFYMVYNKNTTLSPAAQKFKEFVLDLVAEE